MSQPYIGEIRMAGFNFAPYGWALCQGQTLSIDEFSALFTLIGTTYGGNGQTTFNLPDLQCRLPFHQGTKNGNTMVIGQKSGSETVTLLGNQIPTHNHVLMAVSGTGDQPSPQSTVWAGSSQEHFTSNPPSIAMNGANIHPSGGSLPHDNLSPFQVVNFIISLYGIFPSQG